MEANEVKPREYRLTRPGVDRLYMYLCSLVEQGAVFPVPPHLEQEGAAELKLVLPLMDMDLVPEGETSWEETKKEQELIQKVPLIWTPGQA